MSAEEMLLPSPLWCEGRWDASWRGGRWDSTGMRLLLAKRQQHREREPSCLPPFNFWRNST